MISRRPHAVGKGPCLAVVLSLASACAPDLQLELTSQLTDVNGEVRIGRTACVTFQQRGQTNLLDNDWGADFVQEQSQRAGLLALSYFTSVSDDPNIPISGTNRRLIAALEFDEHTFDEGRTYALEFITQQGTYVELAMRAMDDCVEAAPEDPIENNSKADSMPTQKF